MLGFIMKAVGAVSKLVGVLIWVFFDQIGIGAFIFLVGALLIGVGLIIDKIEELVSKRIDGDLVDRGYHYCDKGVAVRKSISTPGRVTIHLSDGVHPSENFFIADARVIAYPFFRVELYQQRWALVYNDGDPTPRMYCK